MILSTFASRFRTHYQAILKSTLAFLLGSLFTWLPALREPLRPYFKLTNAVYVMLALVQNEPNGTVGFMLEATGMYVLVCCVMAGMDALLLPLFIHLEPLVLCK